MEEEIIIEKRDGKWQFKIESLMNTGISVAGAYEYSRLINDLLMPINEIVERLDKIEILLRDSYLD